MGRQRAHRVDAEHGGIGLVGVERAGRGRRAHPARQVVPHAHRVGLVHVGAHHAAPLEGHGRAVRPVLERLDRRGEVAHDGALDGEPVAEPGRDVGLERDDRHVSVRERGRSAAPERHPAPADPERHDLVPAPEHHLQRAPAGHLPSRGRSCHASAGARSGAVSDPGRWFVQSSEVSVSRTLGSIALFGLVGCSADGGPHRHGDCGVAGGADFRVRVVDAFVFPYKPETEVPWDWDGDVPDWIVDLTGALGTVLANPGLKTTAEILDIVDEVAPVILEGTVPPDPVLVVDTSLQTATTTTTTTFFGGTTWTYTYGTETLATADTGDDTYEPRFDRAVGLELGASEDLWIDLYDEDLAFDDYIGSAVLERRDLRRLAKCGVRRVRGLPGTGLYSARVEVVPR